MQLLLRFLRQLPLAVLSPVLALLAIAGLWLVDLLWLVAGRRHQRSDRLPDNSAASVVIPNWNGRDLLERYLPSVVEALAGNPDNEIIVVDNASTDGSVEYLRLAFPSVRVLALDKNYGFGGGSNRGFAAASNDIVVLLNSDMRVAPDFLEPLLNGFGDERVFAVSCQIFFSDPAKPREETGLTQAWWSEGALRVRHRIDEAVTSRYPCFYGGGGSTAFDRGKFLQLGGFDPLLSPFYLEDTDLGFLAWKRGWQVYYEPASRVWHEHRGTIGRKFTPAYVQAVLKKNFLLFAWKNIHEPARLLASFGYTLGTSAITLCAGHSPERSSFAGLARAFLQLPAAMVARWRARSLAEVGDTEAFRRPLGGYFRDRFAELDRAPERLGVLFLSPYPVCPPVHGGAVFMSQTLLRLGSLARVNLIALLDAPGQIESHQELAGACESMEFIVRMTGRKVRTASLVPHSVVEFSNHDLEWLIHRQIYTREIDVLQLEYTNMGQYAAAFDRLAVLLFEHDVYFQSISRGLAAQRGLARIKAVYEYLRALRYELRLLPRVDRVQTCSRENSEYLLGFLPQLRGRLDDHLRAGIEVSRYEFRPAGRELFSMLFLGSFRHLPNLEALTWFTREVLPRVVALEPRARLVVVGSDPPPLHTLPHTGEEIEMAGFVEDIREPLARHAVFVCPILSGSGVRVKLLEAFAAGIPTVSTRLGAEGLGTEDGQYCMLADDPAGFAQRIAALLGDPAAAQAMAARAREFVTTHRNMEPMTRELELTYRRVVSRKRQA